MTELEKLLGYTFKNPQLLDMALTHSSYSHKFNVEDYQRLEYLGDSIVGFVIADELYKRYPDADEGVLTQMRVSIVSADPLAQVVKQKGYYKFIKVGYGSVSKKNYADIFESICGAIYLDRGIEFARQYVVEHLENLIVNAKSNYHIDYKSMLLEKYGERVEFVEVSMSGPAHSPTFEEAVYIDGKLIATASGNSKKQAQQNCSKIALEHDIK